MPRLDDAAWFGDSVAAAAVSVYIVVRLLLLLLRSNELIEFQLAVLFDPYKNSEPLSLLHILLDESHQVLDL